MRIERKTDIEPSDIVVVDGTVYRASTKDGTFPCIVQCDFYDGNAGRCRGYCYRWGNCGEVVFRRLMDARMLSAEAVVTATPFDIDLEIARRQQANSEKAKARYYERKKQKNLEK